MREQTIKAALAVIISLVIILSQTSLAFALPQAAELELKEIDSAISGGFEYIKQQMNPDGGIRWFDESSSTAATLRVVQALAAAGYKQDYLMSNTGHRPIDFLKNHGMAWVNQVETDSPGFSAARAGQLLTAVAAANEDPNEFSNDPTDLVFELKSNYDPAVSAFGTATDDNITDQVWSILGLIADHASVPVEAVDGLASAQAADGSWNDGFGSYLDTTPLVILALVGSGRYDIESAAVQSAINFMKQNQQPNGGWQTEWDTGTNANITGVMLQAISVLGQRPTDEQWQQEDGDPLSALLAIQQENGAFGGEFSNAYSTADAIIGLSNRNITSLGYLQTASKAFDFLFTLQDSTGGWGSVGQTIDVILAFRTAGWQPNTVTSGNSSPLEFLADEVNEYIQSGPDAIGKAILGVVAGGMDPYDFFGLDLTQRLLETYNESSQAFGLPDNTWHQALSILGLYATEIAIPQGAVETLVSLQQEDGGWEYEPGLGNSADSTSIAVQALLASGHSQNDDVIKKALNYMAVMQMEDGGWGNASTTAYAIMMLNLLDQTPDEWITESGKSTFANLISYQKANGSFVYSWEYPDDNIMSTSSALLALFGADYLIQKSENTPQNYAAIMIDPGEDEVQTKCVEFSNPSITGFDLLDASGFEYTIQEGFTQSILGISNPKGETNYWSYWYWDGREWMFQSTGASTTAVFPGTVEAWHFTSWELYPSLPPQFSPNFEEICGVTQLANYQQQPFLDFNDLQAPQISPGTETVSFTPESGQKPTLDNDQGDTAVPLEQVPEGEVAKSELSITPSTQKIEPSAGVEKSRSVLPWIIIGAVAIITLAIFLPLLSRKRR